MRADRARYPISLSAGLHDENGRTLVHTRDLDAVGEVETGGTSWSILYGSSGSAIDISDAMNDAVEKANGEGIVNLSVETSSCALNWFFPLTLLPIWPGCIIVDVKGDVVRRRVQHHVQGGFR